MKISILMLTYNAPEYVLESIIGVNEARKRTENLELVVLDNNSEPPTKELLQRLKEDHLIDVLVLNPRNDLFAKGNNLASQYARKDATHYLLLNSDIKVCDPECFNKLIEIHPKEGGISSLGAVISEPIRADGYCLLIDKYLYDKYRLDESFEWWWSITKLQSQVLAEGLKIRAVKNHEKYLHHYGGKSGDAWKGASGMDIKIDEVMNWFSDKKGNVEIVEMLGTSIFTIGNAFNRWKRIIGKMLRIIGFRSKY